MAGKVPPDVLMKYVISRVGVSDPRVLVGPSIGEDAAVIDLGDGRVLVVHADPISGAIEYLGWLAVHIASNDVAVTGARPQWLLPVLYLPEGVGEDVIDRITSQIDLAAREVGAMVVGGHSEYTVGLERPLISMTAIGITGRDRYVRTGGARPGDLVLVTKVVGIEGTAILASDFSKELLSRGVPKEVVESGRNFIRMVSVVREATLLAEGKLPTSMHDPTEGGVLGGLLEVAYASGTSIVVRESLIPVAYETRVFCKALGLDPLKLISSGTLIATIPRGRVGEAVKLLNDAGVNAVVIGEVVERGDSLVSVVGSDGSVRNYSNIYVVDEVFRLWTELTDLPHHGGWRNP